jgi:hypothetical protein
VPGPKTHDALPSTLTSDCTIAPPPDEAGLVDATKLFPAATTVWEARFLIMYDAYMEQTGNLIDCDLQVGSIRSWDKQHLELKYEPRKTAD